MIITKKALPRRTFLRGVGVDHGAAAAGRDDSRGDRAGQNRRQARLVGSGFVFMPMGCDITRWTPPGEKTLDELSPILSSLAPVRRARYGDHAIWNCRTPIPARMPLPTPRS